MLNCEIINGNSTSEHPSQVIMIITDTESAAVPQLYALNPQDTETLALCLLRMAKRVQNGDKD